MHGPSRIDPRLAYTCGVLRLVPLCLHSILPTAYNNIIRVLNWGLIVLNDYGLLPVSPVYGICNSLVQYWRLINKTEANMFYSFLYFILFHFFSFHRFVDYIMFNVHSSSHRSHRSMFTLFQFSLNGIQVLHWGFPAGNIHFHFITGPGS